MATRACPHCGVAIDKQMDFCPQCGEVLKRKKAPSPELRPTVTPKLGYVRDEKRCPECLRPVGLDVAFCPSCGVRFGAMEAPSPKPATEMAAPVEYPIDNMPAGAWLALAGGVLMVVGSFLPWMQAQAAFVSVTRNGMQLGNNMGFSADGLITLLFGVLTCVIGISRLMKFRMPKFIQGSTIITGIIVAVLTAMNAVDVNDWVKSLRSEDGVSASLGYGLWVIFLGCALAVLGGVLIRSAHKTVPVAEARSADVAAEEKPPEVAVPTAAPSMADELVKLAALRDRGVLTDEEFAAQKARLLGNT